jgi:hypothetical protein
LFVELLCPLGSTSSKACSIILGVIDLADAGVETPDT